MLTCGSCGAENPERAKFCLECGAPTARDTGATPVEERKVVTVLFCDLVGFTAASDSADPEDVRARIRPYHQLLRTEVEAYGGTVEKFIGDAVMAVFGAPVSHEDDAERAVRAGLRILEAIQDLNEDHPGFDLSVRVGINTGEAVVALGARPELGEGIVTGDVVNTASRLQGAAPVGAVVVGEGTHRTTEPTFVWEELEPVELKGKAEPVPLWQAVEARSRFGIDIARSYTSPLIGRDLDLSLLTTTFEKTLQGSAVQLVTIVGEPGVGKTRLVSELSSFVDERPELIVWRQGRCLSYGAGIAFWALGEIVKAQAGILESDDPASVAVKLDDLLPEDLDDRDWIRLRLEPLVGLDTDTGAQRDELFTAWRRFLESIASTGPAVFVIEDLHWADPVMLDFLEHLTDWSEGFPMLIVCTSRPELFERNPNWAGGKRNATTINLGPLTDEETSRLIASLLEQTLLPAEVHAVVLERAGGNPLYAEEFVRMLRDRGLLVERGNSLVLAEDAEIPFPDSIQALISARLDTLSPERKRLLQTAAVMGKVFWSGAVETLGALDEATARDALHDLSRKELIRPARSSSMAGQSEWAFWHALVRDVCYGQIPRSARAEKHVAAARWIEAATGERAEDHAEIIAHHYTQAIEYGEEGDDIREAACQHLLSAAERTSGLDVGRAEELSRRAVELSPPYSAIRSQALRRHAFAKAILGDVPGGVQEAEEALSVARTAGSVVDEERALMSLGILAGIGGDVAAQGAAIQRGIEVLETQPAGRPLGLAFAALSDWRMFVGDYEEAIAAGERALAILDGEGKPEDRVSVLVSLAVSRLELGDEGGLNDAREAVATAVEIAPSEVPTALGNLGHCLRMVEGPRSAFHRAIEAAEFAEPRGMRAHALKIRAGALDYAYEMGTHDDVLQRAPDLHRVATEYGLQDEVTWIDLNVARILTLRTTIGRAVEESTVSTAFGSTDREIQMLGYQVAAMTFLSCHDLAQTLEALRGALDVGHELAPMDRTERLPALVRVAVALGEHGIAAEMIQGLADVALPMPRASVITARAAIEEGDGRYLEAVALYDEAAAAWTTLENKVELGYALLGRGRSLLALGRPNAVESLKDARAVFADMGATVVVSEADELLARAIALSS